MPPLIWSEVPAKSIETFSPATVTVVFTTTSSGSSPSPSMWSVNSYTPSGNSPISARVSRSA